MRFFFCFVFLLISILVNVVHAQTSSKEIIIADGLSVIKLKENLYQHISDFEYQSNTVKCNGLIYIKRERRSFVIPY